MSRDFDRSLRSINAAIAKLRNEGALTVRRQRGPSLYSVSSELPRWPVRVAGGLGTFTKDTQREDTQDTQNTRVREPGTGLTSQVIIQNIKPGSRFPVPGAREDEPETEAQPAACPWHPEANLHPVTTYWNLAKIMKATGDEIRYCRGSGGKCSWVQSRDLGAVVAAGGRRLDAQGIEAAYYGLRSAGQPATSSDNSRTGYIDEVRKLNGGRLPWETEEEA